MIQITVTPRGGANLYGLLVGKEVELRKANRGTLHRYGAKTKNRDKWFHESYKGWIRFERCLGGVLVAILQTKNADEEWQLLSAFVGFLNRHFRSSISSINLAYHVSSDED